MERDEVISWQRVTATVAPIHRKKTDSRLASESQSVEISNVSSTHESRAHKPPTHVSPAREPPVRKSLLASANLDSHWERKLQRGLVHPDMRVDFHGHSLASAHRLLEETLTRALTRGQARARARARASGSGNTSKTRLLLIIAGRSRTPHLRNLPGEPLPRGAIRAALLDWLACYESKIIAVRSAHSRHGGDGAVYVLLRK